MKKRNIKKLKVQIKSERIEFKSYCAIKNEANLFKTPDFINYLKKITLNLISPMNLANETNQGIKQSLKRNWKKVTFSYCHRKLIKFHILTPAFLIIRLF